MKANSKLSFILILLFALSLTSCSDNNNSSSENFENFYKKFTTDSIFQLERIDFPIHGRYMDNDLAGTTENDSITWTKQNWNIIHAINQEDLKSVTISKNISDSTAIIKIEGLEFNFILEESYSLKKGKWYLTNLTNLSL